MNNKGFTLVELLAVVVILTGISLVAVASITSSLSKREKKECAEQIELAKNAAKIYFALHPSVDVSTTGVTVKTLKNGGYFTETSKNDKLNVNAKITIVDNVYVFTATAGCRE